MLRQARGAMHQMRRLSACLRERTWTGSACTAQWRLSRTYRRQARRLDPVAHTSGAEIVAMPCQTAKTFPAKIGPVAQEPALTHIVTPWHAHGALHLYGWQYPHANWMPSQGSVHGYARGICGRRLTLGCAAHVGDIMVPGFGDGTRCMPGTCASGVNDAALGDAARDGVAVAASAMVPCATGAAEGGGAL